MSNLHQRAQLLMQLARANERVEKAEAEIAALRKRFAEPPTDAATLNRACDAYQESAEAHGWDAEIVADVLRCDDMRAAIAAAWPVCAAGGGGMTMAFNSYKDDARKNWGCTDRQPNTDELKLGALQRIADATEVMAREYSRLIEQRNIYEEWWRKSKAYSEHLERRNAALRGQITKLRKRLGATW